MNEWVEDQLESFRVWWLMLGSEKRQMLIALGIAITGALINLAAVKAEMRIRNA